MLLREKIPFHYVFGKIKTEMLVILVYSVIVWIFYKDIELNHITIPLSVASILGTVLSLLLGFRSNMAYERWWEARHIWGSIVNDSRSFARELMTFMHTEYDHAELELIRAKMVRHQVAWAYVLGRQLRGQEPLVGAEGYFDSDELQSLSRYSNIAAGILNLHGANIRLAYSRGYINRYQQVELDRTVSKLCDAQGKCERIKNTVFPVTYSLYIHFSLLLFICMLPFTLIAIFGAFEILAVVAISACFLLVEKMAIHLQDPFENKPTDTPMTTIAMNIEQDLMQTIERYPIAGGLGEVSLQDSPNERYFIM